MKNVYTYISVEIEAGIKNRYKTHSLATRKPAETIPSLDSDIKKEQRI